MLYLEVGNTRFSAWTISFAFGLVITGGLGLLAEWQGIYLSGWTIWFSFMTAFGLIPFWVGFSVMLNWQAHNRLDVAERKARIYGNRPAPSPQPIITPDVHTLAWQPALIEFVLWSESLGSLTSTAHVGKSVSGPDDWEALTNPLLAEGWVYKTNGVPTSWHPGWSPARAVLALSAGKFETPEAAPPRVTPLPLILG